MIYDHLKKRMLLCPYCKEEVQEQILQIRCSVCRTIHHEVCWQENGHRCAIFQCPGDQTLRVTQSTLIGRGFQWICAMMTNLPALLLLWLFHAAIIAFPFAALFLCLPLLLKPLREGFSPGIPIGVQRNAESNKD
jgi:hypothetical protein